MSRELPEEELYFPNWSKLVKLATLILWFLAFVLVWVTGRYRNFLRPAFWILMASAALLVLGMVVSQCRGLRVKHEHDAYCLELGYLCSYKHRFEARFLFPVLIFFLPLVYILFSGSQGLNTFAALQRLMASPGEGGAELTLDESKLPETAPQLFPEVRLNKLNTSFGEFEGKPVKVIGMVYTRKDMPQGQFLLMRFVITCCAADAQPEKIYVKAPPDKVPPKDSWAAVEGIPLQGSVGLGLENAIYAYGVEKLEADKIPKNPYL